MSKTGMGNQMNVSIYKIFHNKTYKTLLFRVINLFEHQNSGHKDKELKEDPPPTLKERHQLHLTVVKKVKKNIRRRCKHLLTGNEQIEFSLTTLRAKKL